MLPFDLLKFEITDKSMFDEYYSIFHKEMY